MSGVTSSGKLTGIAMGMVTLFPKGSGGEKTRAKDEIWTAWDKFKAGADAFKAAAPKLIVAAKSNGATVVKATLADVGKTCGGCHKPNRKPKK